MDNANQNRQISNGAYIAFSIDAVATLAALNDPVVNEVTAKMKPKTYVGCVEQVVNALDFEHPYRLLDVQLLHRRLPAASECDALEPGMCVPVLPNTEHPSSRPPLVLNKPLPWDDCYHHTVFPTATFRVPSRPAAAVDVTMVKQSMYFRRLRTPRGEDRCRREDLQAAYIAAHPAPEAELDGYDDSASVVSDADDADEHDHSTAALEDPVEEGAGESDAQDDTAFVLGVFAGAIADSVEKRPHDTMTLATVSYDLASLSTFAPPEEFFKEQEYLFRLEKESKERAIERARRADEEAFGNKTAESHHAFSARRLLPMPQELLPAVRARLRAVSALVKAKFAFRK